MLGGINVVIHDVHDNADAFFMKRLYHFLELTDTHLAVIRVGGVGALGNVVVDGIIAPVIFHAGRLVDGAEIKYGIQLDMSDAELFQIIDAGRIIGKGDAGVLFGKSQKLAAMILADAGGVGG